MTDADTQTLRAYLSERDVPCPACGYNLRGVQDPVCPECGGPVELAIAGPGRARGFVLLLMVAFGWLALASGMNAARDARAALAQSAALPAGSVRVVAGGSFSQAIVINGTGVRAGQPITMRRFTTTPTAVGGTRIWAQVSWKTWLVLAWSGGLALAAAAGLFVVLLRRRTFLRNGPGRAMIGAALAMVVLHLSVQLLLFVRELAA